MTQETINDAVKGLHALADIISEMGPHLGAAVGFKTAADGTDGALGGPLGDRPLPSHEIAVKTAAVTTVGGDHRAPRNEEQTETAAGVVILPSEEVINSTSAADVPNSEEKDETKGEERDLPPLDSPIEKEAGKKAGKEGVSLSARARVFVKPTPEEIAAYIKEIKASVNAEAFFDFYQSNGWKVGKNPMKDWKATVRGWVRRRCYDIKAEPKFTGTRASNWRGTRKEDLDDVLG